MKNTDLLKGKINIQIIKLALPIIAGSFFQMLYNLTDIFWVGKLGAESITAVGIIGYVQWFIISIALFIKVGSEVLIAQNVGKKNIEKVHLISRLSLKLIIILSIIIVSICILTPEKIVGIFELNDNLVDDLAVKYLKIIGLGIFFMLLNFLISGIYTGLGDSKTPFYANAIGLTINIFLDFLLISGYIFNFRLGVEGAAIATVISHVVVFIILSTKLWRNDRKLILFVRFISHHDKQIFKEIFKIGFPVASHSLLFAFFAILIARIVAVWGSEPLAVITIGANVEALSWMTASGFSTALSVFVGQNYGAKQWARIRTGFRFTLLLSASIGFFVNLLLFFFPASIMSIFSDNQKVIDIGINYLQIVSISQIFMCLEMTASGVFYGIGKTIFPAIVGIFFNALRVLMVFIVANYTIFETNGVWWSISLSTIIKGIILLASVILLIKKYNKRIA